MTRAATPSIFSVPKLGNTSDENEDGCCVRRLKTDRSQLLTISDGATESSFSKEWARVLVNSPGLSRLFKRIEGNPPALSPSIVEEWLRPLQRSFTEKVVTEDLPWYAREKANRGAFATLLGLRVSPKGTWTAISCGDSCLFCIAEGNLVSSFPLSDAAKFGNRPNLISSKENDTLPEFGVSKGKVDGSNNIFILATDAIAAWLLEDGYFRERHGQLLACRNEDEFADLVAIERHSHRLKNDDSTVLIYRVVIGKG